MERRSETKFEQMVFEKKNEQTAIAIFLRRYYFEFEIKELRLKGLKIKDGVISAEESEKSLSNAVNKIISRGFDNLINSVSGRKTIYIHKNSGIPLIGTNTFGIVDRNTNCIEIKPLTGCNLNCIYCSVDEGRRSETKKTRDFLVEREYLVSELNRLVSLKHKTDEGIEIHIGPQGEPLLYPEIVELIADMRTIGGISRISMDTNGLLLAPNLIDRLVKAGLTRFNISLNSLEEEICSKIANRPYNISRLKDMINYIEKNHASKGLCEIVIAPVLLEGYNDLEEDMGSIVNFAKNLSGTDKGVRLGIQNFLQYKNGRNPVRQKSWEDFFALLKKLEKTHGTKLILEAKDFSIIKNKVLEKPFKKGDTIIAEIKCEASYSNEKIAVAKDRAITVMNCNNQNGRVKIRLVRDKHNIFDAVLVG